MDKKTIFSIFFIGILLVTGIVIGNIRPSDKGEPLEKYRKDGQWFYLIDGEYISESAIQNAIIELSKLEQDINKEQKDIIDECSRICIQDCQNAPDRIIKMQSDLKQKYQNAIK